MKMNYSYLHFIGPFACASIFGLFVLFFDNNLCVRAWKYTRSAKPLRRTTMIVN